MTVLFPLAVSSWGEEEIVAMNNVIASERFTMGPYVAEFERQFAAYLGCRFAVMVNSGSSANLLMVAALFYLKHENRCLKAGDEVIVPAVSWSTSYSPLYQYGLKLVFVDIDRGTMNYDYNQLEQAITRNTKLILAVNLLGNPNDFSRIQQIIGERSIYLIEDNCESLGAEFEGRKAGTFGIMGSFSTFFSHHISTMEGGVVATNDEELYHVLLALRAHGWTRDLPERNHVCGAKSPDEFYEAFRFVLPGYNVRPTELAGAIGIEQLQKLPDFVRARRKNAKLIADVLHDHPRIEIQREIGNSSWFGFSLVPRPGSNLTRDELRENLADRGFECRPIVAGNFVNSEVIRFYDYRCRFELRNAAYIDECGLFIGNHHIDLSRAAEALAEL